MKIGCAEITGFPYSYPQVIPKVWISGEFYWGLTV